MSGAHGQAGMENNISNSGIETAAERWVVRKRTAVVTQLACLQYTGKMAAG